MSSKAILTDQAVDAASRKQRTNLVVYGSRASVCRGSEKRDVAEVQVALQAMPRGAEWTDAVADHQLLSKAGCVQNVSGRTGRETNIDSRIGSQLVDGIQTPAEPC